MNPSQQTRPTPEIKFCVNCVQFASPEKDGEVPTCHLSQMIDIVTGSKFYPACMDMRHPEAPCGKEAKFFQPIPMSDKTVESQSN